MLEVSIDTRSLEHCIMLKDDSDCEINSENFFAVLETSAFRVTVDPNLDRAMITIDDTNEPECGE